MRLGKGKHGENLYPAMPYTAYIKVTDADMHHLWQYMQTVKPVNKKVESNQLPFPFNIRLLMAGWNLLFFDNSPFKADPARRRMTRGAYLVNGAGPLPLLPHGQEFPGRRQGSCCRAARWRLACAGDHRQVASRHRWLEAQQTVQYLKSAVNDVAVAAGPMAEAVTNSTQHMTDADLRAMAVYLKICPVLWPGPAGAAGGEQTAHGAVAS